MLLQPLVNRHGAHTTPFPDVGHRTTFVGVLVVKPVVFSVSLFIGRWWVNGNTNLVRVPALAAGSKDLNPPTEVNHFAINRVFARRSAFCTFVFHYITLV